MLHRYSFESNTDEQQPLDIIYSSPQHTADRRQPPQRRQSSFYDDDPNGSYYDPPSPPPPARGHNANSGQQRSWLPAGAAMTAAPPPLTTTIQHAGDDQVYQVSPMSPPRPPPHRRSTRDPQYSYPPSASATGQLAPSIVTPGADNFGDSAAGGMAAIAYTVAEQNARDSGLQAMRGISQPQQQSPAYGEERYDDPDFQYQQRPAPLRPRSFAAAGQSSNRSSGSSQQGLGTAALVPGGATSRSGAPSRRPPSYATDVYADDPYQGYSGHDPNLGVLDPSEIEDDGDEGLEYGRRRSTRMSVMNRVGHSRRRDGRSKAVPAVAAVGAVAAGGAAVAAAVGNRLSSGVHYSAVQTEGHGGRGDSGSGVIGNGNGGGGGSGTTAVAVGSHAYDDGGSAEKSEWLAGQSTSSKRWRWAAAIGLGVAIVAGIVCGVVFGVVLKNKNNGSSSGSSSSSSSSSELSIKSPEIQKLLNNTKLHKVFPGIDYTPINTQYPDCLTHRPSQNNVTRDVAVLSQLTNTIRLYGTDCNQTEMTIEAINRLEMQDTVKIWMGVWQDGNATTNARQLEQMWDVLDASGSEPFVGIIVANEILFRKQMTTTELSSLLSEVRSNLSAHGAEGLPVATSDLGTVWDAALAEASDYVMANIHPFFGGVNATDAAAWTYDFWETDVGAAFKTNTSRNIISETGWPSQGGEDCGTGSTETSCPDAAVAGIGELNRFMEDWVCQALANGTQYFWFEAFDEPWKISYDTDGEAWEDHWGLMDVNRNLKTGVTIPDCGGLTV